MVLFPTEANEAEGAAWDATGAGSASSVRAAGAADATAGAGSGGAEASATGGTAAGAGADSAAGAAAAGDSAGGAVAGALTSPWIEAPHSAQNFAFSETGWPHCTQVRVVIGRAFSS